MRPSTENFEIAPWSKVVVWITIIITIMMAGISTMFIGKAFSTQDTTEQSINVLLAAGIAIMLLLFFVFMPIGYRLDDVNLTVLRWGPKRRIPVAQIESVGQIDASMLRHSIRVMGCGGFGGYYGLFSNKTLGRYRAYITRNDNLVLVRLKEGRPVVLSPKEPELFVKAVDTAIN